MELTKETWDRAQRDFVEDGILPAELVARYGMPRLELGKRIVQSSWRTLREEYLSAGVSGGEISSLQLHETTADDIVSIGRAIAAQLRKAEIPEAERRELRAKAEILRTLTEAIDRATRLARDVRGMRAGVPSVPQKAETTEIEYFTRVVREDKPEEQSA